MLTALGVITGIVVYILAVVFTWNLLRYRWHWVSIDPSGEPPIAEFCALLWPLILAITVLWFTVLRYPCKALGFLCKKVAYLARPKPIKCEPAVVDEAMTAASAEVEELLR
jgi:hypothetical protein